MMTLNVDWNTVKSVIETLESVSVTTAAIYAALGFHRWRKEIIEKRKIELAEEVVDIFLRMPNIFLDIRSPFGREGESLNPGQIAFERIEGYKEFFSRIDATRYRFLAYFGQDKEAPFIKVRKALGEVVSAAHMYVTKREFDSWDTKLENRMKDTIWTAFDERDNLQTCIEEARDEILKICLPILKASVK